jgi:hypothetical protein
VEKKNQKTLQTNAADSMGAPSKQEVSITDIGEARMAQYFGNI